MSIADNLKNVHEKIEAACEKAGRNSSEVTLIAVSKTKPVSMIFEAMSAGTFIFGENKVQELKSKILFFNGETPENYPALEVTGNDVKKLKDFDPQKMSWHLIGTLQNNKVKYLPSLPGLKMIHSVDGVGLAKEIDSRYAKYFEQNPRELSGDLNGNKIDILVEVNMAHEETKMGLSPEDAYDFVSSLSSFEHLNVRGLMTIAPETDDPETNRRYFAGLYELKERVNAAHVFDKPLDSLSMGMTGDYAVAVEEGATLVRVGTGIFGARNYSV